MARILRRGFTRQIDLSEAQREILLHGAPILAPADSPHFATEDEAAAAWRRNRARLMIESETPGSRPYGYFKFELNVEPKGLIEEAAALDRRGLLDRDEARRVEELHLSLNPQQTPEACTNVPKNYDGDMARAMASEFRAAADWHARRGRKELEAKYRNLQLEIERNN